MFIVTVYENRKVKHRYLSHHLPIDNAMVMHFKVENFKLHEIFNITQEISNDHHKKMGSLEAYRYSIYKRLNKVFLFYESNSTNLVLSVKLLVNITKKYEKL